MKIGIVGLPNVGKSTLFNAITKAGAEAANYPFCTIEPNVGIVAVPDERVEKLAKIYNSKSKVLTTIEFFDIAGLVKGASDGEGLGNKFLSHIREVDAICHVVRCFEDTDVVHVNGKVDPLEDVEIINLELIFSDIEILERRLAKTRKAAKADKSLQKELDLIEKLMETLKEGKSARTIDLSTEEKKIADEFNLLSIKPIIYVANVSEDMASDEVEDTESLKKLREFSEKENSKMIKISAQIEEEIAQLEDDEKTIFLQDMGMKYSGLDKLIKASYDLLGLISFITAGEDETRAWTIKEGTKAPQAAGKIHTDMERGFIRAEVIAYEELIKLNGDLVKAREKGLIRSEGKEYIVKDGDVVLIRFNV